GEPGRRGGHPPGTAHRGLAPAVPRLRPHRRRPPVLATPQARRERPGAAVPAHGARGRGEADRARGRIDGCRSMRYRLVLVVTATASLVLVAFLVPLAVLVRSAAADRAVNAAVTQTQALAPAIVAADRRSLPNVVDQANADGGYQLTVFLP